MKSEKKDKVIFQIYDSERNFLGYKADSFWNLSEKRSFAKEHPLKDASIYSNLFKNLLYFCNMDSADGGYKNVYAEYIKCEGAKLNEEGQLEVFVEDIGTGEFILKYVLFKDNLGKYKIKKSEQS